MATRPARIPTPILGSHPAGPTSTRTDASTAPGRSTSQPSHPALPRPKRRLVAPAGSSDKRRRLAFQTPPPSAEPPSLSAPSEPVPVPLPSDWLASPWDPTLLDEFDDLDESAREMLESGASWNLQIPFGGPEPSTGIATASTQTAEQPFAADVPREVEDAVFAAFGAEMHELTDLHYVTFLHAIEADIEPATDAAGARRTMEDFHGALRYRSARERENYYIFHRELEEMKLPEGLIKKLIGNGPTVLPFNIAAITRRRWTPSRIVAELNVVGANLGTPTSMAHAKQIHQDFKASLRTGKRGRATYTDSYRHLATALAKRGLDWQELSLFIGGIKDRLNKRIKEATSEAGASGTAHKLRHAGNVLLGVQGPSNTRTGSR